ncbi:MAG TPA: hypothetical protein VGM43_27245 [Bryobacteraceae bacterium]|jgi:hypothetical protein
MRFLNRLAIVFVCATGFFGATANAVCFKGEVKGSAGPTVDVFSSNDSGRLPLSGGARYILFLYQKNGRLMADPCGNSAKLVSPFR